MKVFKWWLIDDIDKMCYQNGLCTELKKRVDMLEDMNWEQYLKIKKLEEENLWLKNHQKIEIRDLEMKEFK